jgi:hypothetical protein
VASTVAKLNASGICDFLASVSISVTKRQSLQGANQKRQTLSSRLDRGPSNGSEFVVFPSANLCFLQTGHKLRVLAGFPEISFVRNTVTTAVAAPEPVFVDTSALTEDTHCKASSQLTFGWT